MVENKAFTNSKPEPKSLSIKEMSDVERLADELEIEKRKNARLERTIETLKKTRRSTTN